MSIVGGVGRRLASLGQGRAMIEKVRGGGRRARMLYAVAAGIIVCGGLWGAISSRAQTAGAAATAPAMSFLKGVGVEPDSLTGDWTSTTATDGLCRDYSANSQICPSGARPRAPEIRELARALRGGPGLTSRPAAEIGEHVDLVYEYVRNSITTEFLFGTHKGPLGTVIERSGTPFDQAQLMVELLKESGLAATYRFGQISLTGTDVYDWTGFQDAKAACRYFAAGGIPALINGSANCESLSGDVQTASISHVWVQVPLASGTYLYDPSFKRHTHVAGLDVRAAMGLTAGQPESVATSGVATSSGSVSGFNNAGLKTLLDGYSGTLLTRLRQADMQGAGMDEVIGGERIIPVTRPVGGHRQTSLSHAGVSTGWTAIPDKFRAVLKIQRRVEATGQLSPYGTFFMDEIYGRRLEIDPAVPLGSSPYSYSAHPVRNPVLRFDGVEVRRDLTAYEPKNFDRFTLNLRLEIDHPFAALGGSYGDVAFERRIVAANPVTLVYSAGRTTQALGAKWASEQAQDRYHALYGYYNDSEGEGFNSTPYGDKLRFGLAAKWLSQFSMASRLNANIAGGRHQSLHNLGFIYSAPSVRDSPGGEGVLLGSGPEIIDIVSAVAVTSRTNDAAARRGATHAIAAAGAALEGSIMEQLSGSPDSISVARRFAWSNAPETGETTTMTPRRFRAIAPNGVIPAASTLTFDGAVGGPTVKPNGTQAPMQYPDRVAWFKDQLRASLARYANDGFEIATSEDAGLGPGNLHAYWFPIVSRNRGGAFVAKRYDASGDVESVAYVVTSYFDESKGGGAPNSEGQAAALQSRLTDGFEDRSSALGVNLANGAASYSSPVLRSIGQGEFPYRVEERLEVRGGGLAAGSGWGGDPWGGPEVVSSLSGHTNLSGSGEEGMGASRIEAAVPAIVAFAAMQDMWRSATTQDVKREVAGAIVVDWWTRLLVMNTATVAQGAQSVTFVRPGANLANDYISAGHGADRLEVGGAFVPRREDLGGPAGSPDNDPYNSPPLDLAEIRTLEHTATHITWISGDGQRKKYNTIGNFKYLLAEWSFPRGVTLTFDVIGETPHVSSNVGWTMNLHPGLVWDWGRAVTESQWLDGSNAMGCLSLHAAPDTRANHSYPASVQRTVANAASVSRRLQFRAPVSRTIDRRPDDFCRLESVSLPGSAQAAVAYTFNSVNQVKEARDAIAAATPAARGAHKFFIAEGYRGEREDPLGGRYAVETLRQGRESRHIDEEGRVTQTDLDGRARVVRRTAAYGNIFEFKYDDRDNVIELRRLPRANCGTDTLYWCQTSITTATYHPTWNRVSSITLPATVPDGQPAHTWNFAYDNKGRLSSQTSPAVFNARNGLTQAAVWETGYDVFGRINWTKDPTGIEAATEYGTNGQVAWCLSRIITSTQASTGLNQATALTCNALGDILSETDARGNTTTSTWDSMRRRLTLNGPAATNIRSTWTYDADGRVLTESEWDSAANAWRTITTDYSLTGQSLLVTDPAGDRARTCYDGLDRPIVAVDPSGRAKSTEYNRAGQPRFIRQWYTASVTDPTCALTAARPSHIATHVARELRYNAGGLQSAELDSNGNLTSMTYDGLGRLMLTTFADGKYVQTLRNERDQVYITFKRGGDIHQAYYDAIGRVHRIWEHPAASVGKPYPFGRHTGTSYDLADRPMMTWVSEQTGTNGVYDASLERDIRTYVYDGAGRVIQDKIKPSDAGMGSNQLILTYGYDAANNRTSIEWPDGYRATYRFDAANRADRIQFGTAAAPTANQADIVHDSLSRRTSLTRSNGTVSAWTYEADDDLSGINHAWVSGSAQAPATYGFQRDAAGRITMTGANRADLEWMPTVAEARTYGAPNNLNQLPSANGTALTWDANGNLDSYGTRDYVWTWGNRLAEVHTPTSDTFYGYDAQDRRTWMKEDNVVTRTLWSGDDEAGDYADNGTVLRRYIPDGSGAMDARLAVVDAANAVVWFHTDNLGSVIATTNGAGQPIQFANYSAHGRFGTDQNGINYTSTVSGSPFGYTGRRWDAKAQLYQYRARYYSPELGIFLSHDPIGTKDDPNLYTYVSRDPVNMTDPSGLDGVIEVHPNNRIVLRTEIYFFGAEATPQNIAAIVTNMEAVWTTQAGKYNVTLDVVVRTTAPTRQSDPLNMVNSLEVIAGKTTFEHGHSFVAQNPHGAEGGQFTVVDLKGDPHPGETQGAAHGKDTPGHEVGHIFNRPDILGDAGNIMDAGTGNDVSEQDIDDLIANVGNNNIVKICDDQGVCTD